MSANKILNLIIFVFASNFGLANAVDNCDNYNKTLQETFIYIEKNKIDDAINSLISTTFYIDVCSSENISNVIDKIRLKARESKQPLQMLRLGTLCSQIKICGYQSTEIFTEAANLGSVEAEYALGLAYKIGNIGLWRVNTDGNKAAYWWGKASKHGDVNATAYLADLYEEGEGVLQDYAQALKLRKNAAIRGQQDAMFGLANMYANGRGVEKNFYKAYMWFSLANQREMELNGFKNEITIEARDRAAKKLSKVALSKAQEAANKCLASNYKICE